MRIAYVFAFTVFVLAQVAQAQQQQGPGPGRPDRRAGREGPGGPGGPGGMGLGPMAQRLAGELGLSQVQQEQYDAIVAKYQAQAEQSQGDREQMRELARQYREARQSGDEARAEQLRSQMEADRAGRNQTMDAFVAEVKTILDETQIKKLEAAQERFRQGAEANQRAAEARALQRRLPDELDMTDEQRAQYDALLAEQRKQSESQRGQWAEIRPLMEELREARAAGDEERAAQIQAQIDQKRPGPPDMDAFYGKVELFLTADQKAKLTELRSASAGARRNAAADVRSVLRAAKQVSSLTDQQQEQLKTIMREAQAGERSAADAKARTELAQSVKKQITGILDAKQADEFEQLLQRADRGGRGQRGDDGAGATGTERPRRGRNAGGQTP